MLVALYMCVLVMAQLNIGMGEVGVLAMALWFEYHRGYAGYL